MIRDNKKSNNHGGGGSYNQYNASSSGNPLLLRKRMASKSRSNFILAVAVAVIGSIILLFQNSSIRISSTQQRYDLKPKPKQDHNHNHSHSSNSRSNKEDKEGEWGWGKSQLNSKAAEFETTGTSPSTNTNANVISTHMSMEAEQHSRAYPIWIDKIRAVNSSSHPYGWCVPEDLATNGKNPKGLLFVKMYKCSSSTGAGVTLRIQDGLSKRLNRVNQNQTVTSTCYAHYEHATAARLHFQKRDTAKSFLWSIVREPAQRTLR